MGCDGMECNGVVSNEIILFGFINNEWNGTEHDEIYYISFELYVMK